MRLPQSETIDAFVTWWMGTDAPPQGVPTRARIAPSGNPQAELFILTDMPEADDLAGGGLFTGTLRPMMERMLTALGTARADVWLGSLIAARPGSGQIAEVDLPELGQIARLHIALVRPKRLWVLGQSAKRALLGAGGPPDGGLALDVNQDGGRVVVVHTRHPRLLAENPKYKREAWAAMQALLSPNGDGVSTASDGLSPASGGPPGQA